MGADKGKASGSKLDQQLLGVTYTLSCCKDLIQKNMRDGAVPSQGLCLQQEKTGSDYVSCQPLKATEKVFLNNKERSN